MTSAVSLPRITVAQGVMWVADASGNRIVRLTADGATTPHPVPTADGSPTSIVEGRTGRSGSRRRGATRSGDSARTAPSSSSRCITDGVGTGVDARVESTAIVRN